ncbi:hypothetical protein M9458_026606, partial [Cirrhinus mrigala]
SFCGSSLFRHHPGRLPNFLPALCHCLVPRPNPLPPSLPPSFLCPSCLGA